MNVTSKSFRICESLVLVSCLALGMVGCVRLKNDVQVSSCENTAGLMAKPSAVVAAGEGFTNSLVFTEGAWVGNGVQVTLSPDGRVAVSAPHLGLSWIRIDWRHVWKPHAICLADAWECAYGSLEWLPVSAKARLAPWYFLVKEDGLTKGYGVQVQPNALACWSVRADGFSVRLDVRAGGDPVCLGARKLDAVKIVVHKGKIGESAFTTGRAFCRKMCPNPRLPKEPVYGYNDWYCAYGKNTATNFLLDAAYVSSCAKGLQNRPYVVMDDGWQKHSPPQMKAMSGYFESGMGPWDAAGPHFGMAMPQFCRRIAGLGARPGLWYRPFRAWPTMNDNWKLRKDKRYVDPTVPEVRQQILTDVARFRAWGFKLVKIDYLTFDITRLWGSQLGDNVIRDGSTDWCDRSRTTCEVLKSLYGAMREAAGSNMIIIGCNGLNHLVAGIFELQRIGGDTSGNAWKRTKEMGVNALGFRAIQDRTFFIADADCVGLAKAGAVPWEKNAQWLDLLARSGSALFVSWHRNLADEEFRKALTQAFKTASEWHATGEPVDWESTRWPAQWRFADGDVTYMW